LRQRGKRGEIAEGGGGDGRRGERRMVVRGKVETYLALIY